MNIKTSIGSLENFLKFQNTKIGEIFKKVIAKAVLAANNRVSIEEDWGVEINKPIRTGEGKKVRKAIADIGGMMPE